MTHYISVEQANAARARRRAKAERAGHVATEREALKAHLADLNSRSYDRKKLGIYDYQQSAETAAELARRAEWWTFLDVAKAAHQPANVEIRDLLTAHREGTESLFGARRLSDTEYEAAMRSLG